MLGQFAAGRRFLNLFAYTGTATVAAAMGGVVVTTSADMSRTYLNRAARNLKRKGIEGKRHELVRAEALTWLRAKPVQRRPDLRRSAEFFPFKTHDRHARCAARSRPAHSCRGRVVGGGWPLIFSTHSLRFRLDAAGLSNLPIKDISRQLLPRDFARHPPLRCFGLQRRAD